MKNLLKIWAIAMVVAMAFVFVVNTRAASDSLVKVTLTEGTSTCTLSGYDMSTVVSVNSTVVSGNNTLICNFLESNPQTISLLSEDLKFGTVHIITDDKVNGSGSALTQNGTLTTNVAPTLLLAPGLLDTPRTAYVKDLNEMGTMTQNIKIDVTIDWGTPAWVYTGYLNIDITG